MSQRYNIIVTNPPYMGIKNMSPSLANYVRKTYPDNKYDLYAVFIQSLQEKLSVNGMVGLVTMQTFMFLGRYEWLRRRTLEKDIVNLLQLGTRAFDEISGEVVQTACYVIRNSSVKGFFARYVDLSSAESASLKETIFLRKEGRIYERPKELFNEIPGAPISFWVSNQVCWIYKNGTPLIKIASPRQGMATSDNDRFVRLWYEVDINRIGFSIASREMAQSEGKKWFPYNKGGGYRKWYGNNDYVVNWENDGEEIKAFRDFKNSTLDSNMGVAGLPFIFKENITWSKVCSSKFSVRYLPQGYLFDVSGCSIYGDSNTIKKLISLLNSNVIEKLLMAISQSLNFEVGSIKQLPIIGLEQIPPYYFEMNYSIEKADWDSFETSWDFKRHPLI